MVRRERIPAGSDPAPQPGDVEGLKAALDAANARVMEIRMERVRIRDESPRGKIRELIAETDEDFEWALSAQRTAEKEYGRAFGGGEGQRVTIGPAVENSSAGVADG